MEDVKRVQDEARFDQNEIVINAFMRLCNTPLTGF